MDWIMAKSPKRVTMRQVAELAGVSAMTVSKALSGKPGISEKTRKRILKITQNLDYTPNLLATSFRNDRTNTIGVVMSSTFETVFTLLFHGIEVVAGENGYGILVATAADNLEREQEVIQWLVGKRVDGIIMTSALNFCDSQKKLLDKLGIPYVLTVRSCQDASVTTVLNNNYMGGYSMVEYLASTGSNRFLLLPMDKSRCSSRDRLRGWEDALMAHGRTVAPEHITFTPPTIEAGFETMRAHIRQGVHWDTVVCGNDTIAIGAMEALLEAGIEIPKQVRLSGYDGLPLSGYLRVPLTTIQQPLAEIGRIGMQLLAQKIEDPTAAAQQVVVNSRLVIRCST